jgi:hypothetical protein
LVKLLPLSSNSSSKNPAKTPFKYIFLNELYVFVRVLLFGILLAIFIANNCAHFFGLIKKSFF